MVVPYSVPFQYIEVCLPKREFLVPGFVRTTFATVTMVVIYVKFSIQQCLNYLSSMHSLSASVKGCWVFLNRFLCSTRKNIMSAFQKTGLSPLRGQIA